ncbi:sirohydrochlorin cobaltochelatase [Dethiosulfatibacter aminovorans DSM 17477]|uniref:Sirohydrochlorin cobaltochelatase n=1 Tax=Dethiosulfatibacter aminovorans DSM 17477 TaxID=1121476 RepID=A0A1M6LXS1_9FIRM|nr:sirohydrochlorin cobaltochelatase [Dethiosulfatibacter aminovorans]SHJ75893.1 sirohydrochlorin cobaltochelatase [Dethiosulfatibacter aminovorans DSM 17477]
MKKGILVVSFGTSYEDTRVKCIDSVEKDIQEAYPDHVVRRAFTSRMIIKKLKERDGIHIDFPKEALEKMVDEGFEKIVVQPLHIIPGFEYEKVRNEISMLKHKTEIDIELGMPLLYEEEHYDEVTDALLNYLPEERENQGVVLMGHGTEHYANACYSMLQNKIREQRSDVYIANVEGYPELENISDEILGRFSSMTLAPLMLVAGDHAINDMAGEEDSYRSFLEENDISVHCILKGLGENEAIRKIFVSRVGDMV